MSAKAINYGRTRSFPTVAGNIRMPRGIEVDIENPEAARELSEYPNVQVKDLAGAAPRKVDYSKYTIQQLRQIAGGLKVKKAFFMKKDVLVAALEERS